MMSLKRSARAMDQNMGEDKKFALAFAVLAGIILVCVLFIGKRPGVVDWGNYETNLRAMDLVYTAEELKEPEDLHYTEVIEEFEFTRLDISKIVQTTPGTSLIYPVVIVWFFCSVFHLSFSTAYLAAVYSIITVISFYFIFRALYRLIGYKASVAGALLPFVFLGSEFVTWFNSLELEACVFVGIFMFIGAVLNLVASEKKTVGTMLPILFSGWFLLNAKPPYTTFMAFPMLIIIVVLAYYHKPEKPGQFRYAATLFAILLYIMFSVLGLYHNSDAMDAQANRYDAVYNGLLQVSTDPEADIEALGLPAESIDDIGKSFYLSESDYGYFPRSEEAEEVLFSRITYSKLKSYYVAHPEKAIMMLRQAVANGQVYSDNRFMYVGERADEPHSTVAKSAWWNDVRNAVFAKNPMVSILLLIVAAIAMLLVLIFSRNVRKRTFAISFLCFMAMTFTQLVSPVIIKGWGYIEKELFGYMVLIDAMLLFTGIWGFYQAYLLYVNIQEGKSVEKQEQEIYEIKPVRIRRKLYVFIKDTWIRIRTFSNTEILRYRGRTAILFTIVSAMIIGYVMFGYPRIGCRNDGDYGRVMDAIGISFKTVEDDEESVNRITEEFYWADFDWTDFVKLEPHLSNVYVASLLRLFCEPLGIPYNTFYASIIYAVILVFSYWLIFYSLYTLFEKKVFLLTAVAVIFVFMGKMHLGWINSLFGEGVIYVGIVAMISWMLSIISSPQGKGMWKFIPMLIAARVFCGAKGQVTVAFPIVLFITFVLYLYHVKRAKWSIKIVSTVLILILSGILSIESLRLYQHNDDSNAAMNVWQSMFTGLLAISDDPVQTLLDFDMDPNMVVDIGKHAYYADEDYYIGPLTKEAETELFTKVDTMKLLKYYILHPKYLYRAMDHAAESASLRMPDWLLYLGQRDDEEHDEVGRFSFWEEFRISFAPDRFISYVIIYAVIFIYVLRSLWQQRKVQDKRMQLLKLFYLSITMIGIIQYPLSVIGNGFTDNTKQMYLFILCFDFSIVFAVLEVYRRVKEYNHMYVQQYLESRGEGVAQYGNSEELV